jgi:fructoselysine-6-P-deglycase FrlB-like protein
VLREGDRSLQKKWPVVVLVPDDSAQRSQMLSLVRPLHQAGAIVAVLAPRGAETPKPAAVTFGLNESQDVMSAVAMLKARADVDGGRISLAGIGSGATAVMLAAEAVAAQSLVLVSPAEDAGEVIRRRITPRPEWLGWLNPLCKWAFELGYGVDADDISMVRHTRVMMRPGTRVIPWRGPSTELSPVVAGHTLAFLQQQLKRSDTATIADD